MAAKDREASTTCEDYGEKVIVWYKKHNGYNLEELYSLTQWTLLAQVRRRTSSGILVVEVQWLQEQEIQNENR